MPEFHSEPYLYLPGLTHKSALIAWGAFYFRIRSRNGDFKLVDDSDLKNVHPPRRETIGARSEPFGEATVEVADLSGQPVATASTALTNHCWLTGLSPDTEYTYRVIVNGEEWAAGERRDWMSGDNKGLKKMGGFYTNRFRTPPHPSQAAPERICFAVIGDFGVGVKKPSNKKRRQREIAKALQKAVDEEDVRFIITTGDNLYAQMKFIGIPLGTTGDEDDDWFFTFFQPYRYLVNRIPVYPTIGNHDTEESEVTDDRAQLIDNFYLQERLSGEERAGRASLGPGLFYRFKWGSQVEFICLDTSKEPALFFRRRLFELPEHFDFLEKAFPSPLAEEKILWRIPFSHHPPFCAGPRHHNTESMHSLIPLFQRAGVRVLFSGHEHNFQHSRHEGIDYLVSGGAGKVRTGTPNRFDEAHTLSWSPSVHFLLVTIEGSTMTCKPLGELSSEGGLSGISRRTPQGQLLEEPIIINR